MNHALVIGGTGMLAPVTRALGERGPVTVLARGRRGLDALASVNITPTRVDYTDDDAFHAALRAAVEARGAFDLCVAWVHSTARSAPLAAARYVEGAYFHVLGSATADPAAPDSGRRSSFEALGTVSYHEVILGFVVEGGGSRWLTDQEIASGVLSAVDHGDARAVVGTVEPWSARP